MSGTRALFVGLRRALFAPHLVLLLLTINAATALPAAWLMRDALHDSIGKRTAGAAMLESFDSSWYDEWSGRQDGLTETFEPELSGAGFAWVNFEGWLDGYLFDVPLPLIGLGALHALLWLLLLGGVIDGWARPAVRRGPVGFVRACSGAWPRLLRLAACSLPLYALIYLSHSRAVDYLEEGSRDLAREMPAIFQMLGLYGLTALLLTLVNLWFTAAKVVVVVDQSCGALRGLARSALFVLRRPTSIIGLYYGFAALAALLFGLWSFVAPDATQSTPLAIGVAFAAGQLFVASRFVLKLGLLAGMVELYRPYAAPVAAVERDELEPEPEAPVVPSEVDDDQADQQRLLRND